MKPSTLLARNTEQYPSVHLVRTGLLWLGLMLSNAALAATYTVTNNNSSGVGSLYQAVIDANNNPGPDTIDFAVTGVINIDSAIDITDDLTITGPGVELLTLMSSLAHGGGVTGAITMDDVNATAELVITDMTIEQMPNSSRLIYIANQQSALLEDVYLKGGNTELTNASGSAVAAIGTDLVVRNAVVDNFISTHRGGAVYVQSNSAATTLLIENSLFTRNATVGTSGTFTKFGGAIAAEGDGAVIVRRSSFILNSTEMASSGNGGAIAYEADLVVEDSYFRQNAADSSGGALYTPRFPGTDIRSSRFDDNSASHGGGALHMRGDVDIADSTFFNNAVGGIGGALYHGNSGTVNIVNSTFSANTADGSGGAIFFEPRNPGDTQVNILNTTITDNTSGDVGGGIYYETDDEFLVIVNSIVAGNSATASEPEIRASQARVDFSLIGNDAGDGNQAKRVELTPGNTVYDTDPMLGPLMNNGGVRIGLNPDLTDVTLLTHAVLMDSPVIGAADANAVNSSIALPANDQRGVGFDRVKDGGLEMGAVEYDQPATNQSGGGGSSALSPWMLFVIAIAGLCGRRWSPAN